MLRSIPISFFLAGAALFANPQQPNVRAGSVEFSSHENLLEIRPLDGSIINWKEFSIQPHEVTRFIQSGSKDRVLNRVIGGVKSELLGTLEANGQVFLLNSNGVLIGKEAQIRTGGFYVTTFEMDDDDFLSEDYFHLVPNSSAELINQGQIEAIDGEVYLIAQIVENDGSIVGRNVSIGAGGEWLIHSLDPKKPSVKLSDLPDDLSNPYAAVIKHSGTIEAVGFEENGGVIRLISEDELSCIDSATITSLKGGEIAISGKTIFVGPQVSMAANGEKKGNGGTVLLVSRDSNTFHGHIDALGGLEAGDGGFIEVSGSPLGFHGTVSTLGPKGNPGRLLLDPLDITISSGTDAFHTAGPIFTPTGGACVPGPGNSILNTTTLVNALNSSNVTVQTVGTAGGCLGDIVVLSPFSWGTSSTLTLNAAHDVNVQAQMQATGGGGITLIGANSVIINPATGAGPAEARTNTGNISVTSSTNDIQVQGGTLVAAHAGIFSDRGTITLSPKLNLTVTGGTGSGAYAEISSRAGPIIGSIASGGVLTVQGNGLNAYGQIGVGAASGSIQVASDITFTFDTFSSDVNVIAGSSVGAYAQIGHAPSPASAGTTVSGSIIFNPPNLGAGNNINLTGGGLQATAIIGHGNEFSGNVTSMMGNFQIFAQGAITVQGGTGGNQSHAVIGFHTPQGGPNQNFTANSSILDVRTLISGDINIKGGSGSNGIIGYYNNSTLGALANVTFASIHVQPTDSNLLILTAGQTNSTAHGSAVLGTMDLGGVANSNISIRSGGLQVLGPQIGGQDGSARLINQSPSSSAGYSISVDCYSTPAIADIAVLGGIGSSPGFAEIYSSGTLEMFLVGRLFVNRTLTFIPTLQNGPAAIRSYGAMTINGVQACSDLTVLGGTNIAANYQGSAILQSINSSITLGSLSIPGANNITVGSTTSQAPSQILTGSGTSLLAFSNVVTLQGGQANLSAPRASAEIRSDSGNLNFEAIAVSSLSISGGTGADCFAEISSTLGNVSFSNITGSLSLSGGTGASATNAYAQIGRGTHLASANVQSSISFQNCPGNLTLTANDGPGAYVQIGHSPTNNGLSTSVTGDVTFSTGVNSLTLQGGSVPTNTAIIGHGNELTPFLTSISGSVDVIVSGGTGASFLASNVVGQAHAILGFCNPQNGSAVPLNVSSQSVSLVNQGPTQLTAGVFGSNAIIGYYNCTSQPNTVTLSIQNLTVDNGGAKDVILQAGNDPGFGSTGEAPLGIAAIGTAVNTPGSSAFCNISLNANTLTLNGPITNNNSSARVLNSHPNAANPIYNVTINPTTNINVLGGVGLPNGFADIYSANSLNIQYGGNFYINEAFPTFQNGYAHVVANGNIDINTILNGIDMRLTGGNSNATTGGSADALIESLNGHCFLGQLSAGTINVYIGRVGSESPAAIQAVQGQCAVGASQDIILQGGKVNLAAPFATAQIVNLNGEIDILTGRDLSLIGGTGPSTFAQITTFENTINVNQVGRDLLLTGGSGTQAYAQIGVGNSPTVSSINSSINFNLIGRNVILQGATTGNSGYAQIGHSPFGASLFYTATGDITFPTFGSSGYIQLNGGSVINTTAIIGHGNPLSTNLNSASSSISVVSSNMNGITLNAGTGTESHTVIGFFNPIAGSTPSFSVVSPSVAVQTTGGPITLNANTAMNATIGYYHTAALVTPINVSISSISVLTGTTPPPGVNNFITLNAATSYPNGIASIGTFGPTGSSTTSGITIKTYELDLNGPPAGKDGAARIINNQSPLCDQNNVSITTSNLNELGGLGTGFADIYSSHNMTISFNKTLNVNLNPASPATLQNGNATIISCNDLTFSSNGKPPNNLGNIFVLGGSGIGVTSKISSSKGNVYVGKTQSDTIGVNQITIGRADMLGSAIFNSAQKSINLVTSGSVSLAGGSAGGAFAFMTAFGGMSGTIGGNLNLMGGSTGATDATMTTGSGDLSLISMGSINVLGQASSFGSITQIGTANSLLQLEAIQNLSVGLNGFIKNQGNGDSILNGDTNVYMTDNSFIQNSGTGILNIFAGVSMYLQNTSQILTNKGRVSLVVDNDYPSAEAGIGKGAFSMDSGVVVNTNGGAARIFTASRPLNTISGVINASTFTPGIEFVNTSEEIWGVYYFSSLGGSPFTVFYKEVYPAPVLPAIIASINANNENFEVLKFYDDFLFVDVPIFVTYDGFNQIVYNGLRRLYRDYHMKWIDTLE